MPQISVIVPVYNVEKYINKCVNSILTQSFTDFELILIDDESPDNCGEICDEYMSNDSRVKVIHKKNEGLMAAWMDGVKLSTAKYIAFVDSDDWVEKNMLEELYNKCIQHDTDIVCCDIVYEFPNNSVYSSTILQEGFYDEDRIKNEIYPEMIFNGRYLGRSIHPSRCCKLIKRDLIINNIKYCDKNISFGEDLNITFPIMLDTKRIYISNKYLYHYRQNQSSIIYNYKKNMFEKLIDLHVILRTISFEKNVYDFTNQLQIDFACLSVLAIKNELDSRMNMKDKLNSVRKIVNNKDLKKSLKIVKTTEFNTMNTLYINLLKINSVVLIYSFRAFTSMFKGRRLI